MRAIKYWWVNQSHLGMWIVVFLAYWQTPLGDFNITNYRNTQSIPPRNMNCSILSLLANPSVGTRPQRDPGISRDPGIDLESRSRDFGKSNPGIFRDLSYQTKQWFQRLLLGFDPNLSKKSRDENVRLIPSRKIPGSHQSRDEKSRLIPSRKIPGSRDFAKIPSRKSRD